MVDSVLLVVWKLRRLLVNLKVYLVVVVYSIQDQINFLSFSSNYWLVSFDETYQHILDLIKADPL